MVALSRQCGSLRLAGRLPRLGQSELAMLARNWSFILEGSEAIEGEIARLRLAVSCHNMSYPALFHGKKKKDRVS